VVFHAAAAAGVQFDQNDMAVKLGDIQLMQAGQPLAFDAKTASKYLKDTCAKHGTVNIYVTIGKGTGKGEGVPRCGVFVFWPSYCRTWPVPHCSG
jgi:N-acetylglutamate synthase/N-acetylornithine aminotransferase